MPAINLEAATVKLAHAVEGMDADDVFQFYNELYPATPASGDSLATIQVPLRQQIVEHINAGLEPEEVVDLWGVAFPKDRAVYFNEEDGLLHYGAGDEER
jgi:hypothetical protein